mmetsp:Transcript_28641/g.42389  ORF Transcript_28641/g.42389 Transcript_28641/m.42389 type:complete len:392 (-) Transcript_28641:432-1607(-)|eukprot:CAMPEP_0195515830 /NCGR_PEP_ID=MMETSP0794_2-20130614/6757_1 /TAXON_ID=515487 /ORGANISM="Stephanopyxis turris, Strain CCMP 815" /LENGTH=391 /DNA_ID=CAMNT_0040644317 /DNA_START=205 /DNA_END=1380 /DNA_ORIENTATION=-
MSTVVQTPGSPTNTVRRKKSLMKKLTVTTDSSDPLPTMEVKSPGSVPRRPGNLKTDSLRKTAARTRAGQNSPTSTGASSPGATHHDLSKLASPSTPSRSTDRKHVDNAIITKLQKLGMQEPGRSAVRQTRSTPPKPKTRQRLAVVLDMDECMLHTTSFSEGNTQRYRQEEDRPNLTNRNKNQPLTVTFRMFDGCQGTANLRPHLHWFLDKCTALFDTYVFTAGTEAYASPLLDLVDPERKLKGRFYRTSCRRVVCELGELYLKDLSTIKVPQPLSRMVLVDNNPVSFLVQPCNGIPVVSWYDNIHDTVLKEVFTILKEISVLDDVRSRLDSLFGLKVELKALRRTVGLKNAFEASSVSNAANANSGKGVKKSSLPPVAPVENNSHTAGTTW